MAVNARELLAGLRREIRELEQRDELRRIVAEREQRDAETIRLPFPHDQYRDLYTQALAAIGREALLSRVMTDKKETTP